MQKWAAAFYRSTAWRSCRASYYLSQHGICQRCGGAGKIVHHIREITPSTLDDPRVTLNWENLELLCQERHNREHMSSDACAEGLRFNADGDVVPR